MPRNTALPFAPVSMPLLRWALLAIATLVAAAGCIPVVEKGHNFFPILYDADYSSNQVAGFKLSPSGGFLNPLGPPTATGGTGPQYLAQSAGGRFLYVPNQLTGDVSGFAIDPDSGALALLGTPTPAAGGANLIGSTVDPSGHFLYITGQTTNTVHTFSIDAGTGALTEQGAAANVGTRGGSQPSSIVIDAAGRYAYVGNLLSNNISIFSIDPGTGLLTELPVGLSPSPSSSGNLRNLVIHPSGRFLYAADETSPTFDVDAYTIDATTGALALMQPVSGFVGGTAGECVTMDPQGHFLYVADFTSNTFSVFAIDPTLGGLTLVSTILTGGTNPLWIAVDPSGQFLYVTDQATSDIAFYSLVPSPGLPTSLGRISSGGTGSQSLAIVTGAQ